jgi:DNA-binding YbaB/EbfC family protein
MANILGLMKQAAELKGKMEALQAELEQIEVEGSAGGGMVKVVVSGTGDVQSVHIAPEVVDPDDVEMLEDLVLAAVGDGLRRAQAMQSERLGGVTGGLDLGSLGDLGGLLG